MVKVNFELICNYCNRECWSSWDKPFNCPNCHQGSDFIFKRVKELEAEVKRLKEGVFITGQDNQIIKELKEERQILKSSLGLKEFEKDELKAQIRALQNQLSEKENNQAWKIENQRLKKRQSEFKEKLSRWIKLLNFSLQKK